MNTLNKKAIGLRIKTIRKQKGLTMKEFGKLIEDAAQSLVTRWENGTSIPNNERIKKIAEIGNVSVSYLLYGTYTFNDLSDEEKATVLERQNEVLTKRNAGRTQYILDFLNNLSGFKPHDEALSLLSNTLRYSFIVEKYSNEGTKLIGLLDHIIKILNDYTESGKTKEEVRENLIGYLDYILDNSKNKIE